MNYSKAARKPARRIRFKGLTVLGVVVGAALVAAGTSALGVLPGRTGPALFAFGLPGSADQGRANDVVPGQRSHQAALGEADGVVPDNVTVFDDKIPAVAKLNPELLGALRRAAAGAAELGITFFVSSGWRSPTYQELLLREAISEYGSAAEAARWVATANTSAHVAGDAIDIQNAAAASWLAQHGAGFGLCQVYANESWHFELRLEAAHQGCPPMYADPTEDPRMRQ